MRKDIILSVVALLVSTLVCAQHGNHLPVKESSKPAAKDSTTQKHQEHDHQMVKEDSTEHDVMNMQDHEYKTMSMSHAFSRNLPMTRNGSGTAWLPDNSPMYGYMFHSKNWMYMIHGDLYIRYNSQDIFNEGSRGDKRFDAPNMVMFMGQRNVSKKGLFHFNTMFSLDPLTIGEEGYPLLFQTGETYKGQPLVDKQHPHDLFSELSVSYAYAISPKSDVFVYAAYPGEPALGPAAYLHRPSGFFNPDAPLSHHWVDATHITFGVATVGFRYGNWKLEGSSFTGREPDENRYNFDKPRFDSWSARLSYNPSPAWAFQTSHGFIKQPELLHEGEDVKRTTASVSYSGRPASATSLNLTALWGMNKTKGLDPENGVLLEGSYNFKRTAIYSRYEWVQKSGEELNLDEVVYGHDALFPVNALTAGISYDLLNVDKTTFALGTQISIYHPEKRLSGLYGNNPVAGQIYLRIYPARM